MTPEEKSFEECIDIIDEEIRKRKSKWNLQSLAWMDFEDVSQIIKIHINNKWHLYDIKQPLRPWLNRIISNQLKNLIRNNYGNFTRPCLKCAASEENDGCKLFKKQLYNSLETVFEEEPFVYNELIECIIKIVLNNITIEKMKKI